MEKRQLIRWVAYVVVFPYGIYRLARRMGVRSRGWAAAVSAVGSIVVVSVLGSLAASSGTTAASTNPADPASTAAASVVAKDVQEARGYIVEHGADAYRVRANVGNVELAYSEFLATPTEAKLVALATAAQTAHDALDTLRHTFGGSFRDNRLGNAQLDLYGGANDLKNAMGALVAVTADPANAATVAKFNPQFANAKNEWNNGARTVWRTARKTGPPTI